jgi:hypothetical protein
MYDTKSNYWNELTLCIAKQKIENEKILRLIGVYINNKLSWNYQIKALCSKLNS